MKAEKSLTILGIETTCDETACAVVQNGTRILSNVVSSQVDIHSKYGGVVPELSCRRHIDVIMPVLDEALKTANLTLSEIDAIAVATGPGLIGALLIGINTAKAIALALDKPLIGVNHIEAHLYASIMSHKGTIKLPALGVVLSGGHTTMVEITEIGTYKLIGETVDDAIGEAFDKVAKLLDLPYPGGPHIEKLATLGNSKAFPFRAGKVKDSPFHFSFSGLKTAVLYTLKEQKKNASTSTISSLTADVAASFQRIAFEDVIKKVRLAAKEHGCTSILFGGGVTNSQTLRKLLSEEVNFPLYWPSEGLSLDNAAMIAGLGYHNFINNRNSVTFELQAQTRTPFVSHGS